MPNHHRTPTGTHQPPAADHAHRAPTVAPPAVQRAGPADLAVLRRGPGAGRGNGAARAAAVQRLQRTAGNRATQRLLQIQRKIGFEIETGIPIKKKVKGKGYLDPTYQDLNHTLSDGSVLDVDANPIGGGKIIEFASAPVDDHQKTEDFQRIAALWLGLLTNLRTVALNSPPMRPIKRVVPAVKGSRYMGVEAGSPGAMDRVSIQATHGLRLDQITQFMQKVNLANPDQSSRVQGKQQAATESTASVDPLMTEIAKVYRPGMRLPFKGKTPKVQPNHVEEVRGFLTLMANYMLAGKYVASGYNKNRSFLFYKSKLSDVRNSLVAQNVYAAAALRDPEVIARLKFGLVIATKRKMDDPLYSGAGDPRLNEWMRQIFAGIDDPGFEASKNPWGKDIKPDKVGGGLSAVVEHRDIGKMVQGDANLKMNDTDGILAYLSAVFEANKDWQNFPKD